MLIPRTSSFPMYSSYAHTKSFSFPVWFLLYWYRKLLLSPLINFLQYRELLLSLCISHVLMPTAVLIYRLCAWCWVRYAFPLYYCCYRELLLFPMYFFCSDTESCPNHRCCVWCCSALRVPVVLLLLPRASPFPDVFLLHWYRELS